MTQALEINLNKIKVTAFMLATSTFLIFSYITAPSVSAQFKEEVIKGAEPSSSGSAASSEQTLNNTISSIITVFSWFVGIVSVIMIIYAGYSFVTSNGDTTKIATAKRSLIYVLVGITLVIFAQTIVRWVLAQVI